MTLQHGKIVKIDGSNRQPVTGGYICAKVRKFDQVVYGEDRLLYPAVRKGRKGEGRFKRVPWDEALELVAEKMRAAKASHGGASILPYSYGGSNGLMTQDNIDAQLWRRFGTSRLARTVCAAPTGAANMALYGKMASVSYQDYPEARLIILWGVNPSTSGIHLVPYVREAQSRGAKLVVIDPRNTPLARSADVHLAVRPGSDVAVALAIHRHLFTNGLADDTFLREHTTGADRLRERAEPWTFSRAAEAAGVDAAAIEQVARLYAESSPALVRCGWGLERNRNGGNAAMAVLSLPSVGGKFGVRGGGYSMSNSASWKIERPWIAADEPATRLVNMNHLGRALTDYNDPPVNVLFVYNCNPVVTVPDQHHIVRGLQREDLFTVVFEQVMTDTALYADVVLPATTFLEGYDFARSYGPIHLSLARPVIDAVGEARSNADVFGELAARLDVLRENEPTGELDLLVKVLDSLPGSVGADLRADIAPTAPCGPTPIQFVDVFPNTPDGQVNLFPDGVRRRGAARPLCVSARSGDGDSIRWRSSHRRASARSTRRWASCRGPTSSCSCIRTMRVRVASRTGISCGSSTTSAKCIARCRWRRRFVRARSACRKACGGAARATASTGTALVPDTLTDIAGGACFNDARVQVASLATA